MFLRVKPAAISVYVHVDEIYTFDREGRLTDWVDGATVYRRGLNGRVLRKARAAANADPDSQGVFLAAEEWPALLSRLRGRMRQLHDWIHDEHIPLQDMSGVASSSKSLALSALEMVLSHDAGWYARQDERFRAIYRDIPIIPPDQYRCLYVQATRGCAYNVCTFCDFYRDETYRVHSMPEFRRHLSDAVRFTGEGMAARHSVFLGDANALAAPGDHLIGVTRELHKRFAFDPGEAADNRWRMHGIFSFLDTFMNEPHDAATLRELRRLGWKRVYIGMESADSALRRVFNKPQDLARLARHVTALQEAGIAIGCILLCGFGTASPDIGHEERSTELLKGLGLGAGDMVYLSPLHFHEHQGGAALREAGLIELAGAERQKSIHSFKARLIRDLPEGVSVSLYSIGNFLY